MSEQQPDPIAKSDPVYRVLARKYRPTNFDQLVGQEALVRTLSNGIESGRIAQAFMLTGVRGVGKTTTARIVAKALNCTGPDGQGGPTITPCGECGNCTAIAEDRHVDVQEMDAASRTGVDDIRELIESVRYRPVSARYKIYILDEVHMLSKNAFNALLKTLEEPPEHVKFIFATTEIRKVPVTVLSRCQRFDLRRVPVEKLNAHYKKISQLENILVDDEALTMISRAADGSVRDGLSILDQAIALAGRAVDAAQVRDMLGLADRAQIFDLFDALMKGDVATTLELLGHLYNSGADPVVIIQDLMDVCYWLTRLKLIPALARQPGIPEIERTRGKEMADALRLPVFTRCWQMLYKGLAETKNAPSPIQSAEMVLIRLIHAAELPTPEDIVKKFKEDGAGLKAPSSTPDPAGAPGTSAAGRFASAPLENKARPQKEAEAVITTHEPSVAAENPIRTPPSDSVQTGAQEEAPGAIPPGISRPNPASFRALVQLLCERREGGLVKNLTMDVRLVRFEEGLIEFRALKTASRDLTGKLGKLLTSWTGNRWVIRLSDAPGEETLYQQDQTLKQKKIDQAGNDPLVKAVLAAFPGAKVDDVTERVTGETPLLAGELNSNDVE